MADPSSHVYTIEEFKEYGDRLHFNTVLDFFVNGFTAYIVLKHSTTAMGVYKYYILSTIACAFLMDFHISFIFGPFIMMPSSILCGAGFVSRNLGLFWGRYVQWFIMHLTASGVGGSLLCGFMYQYYSLQGNVNFFHSAKGVAILGISTLLYPLPSYAIIASAFDRNATVLWVKNTYPNSYDLFMSAPCHALILNLHGKIYYSALALQISIAWVLGCIYGVKIHAKLESMKHMLSPSTMKARRQLLISLGFQAVIPSSFIVIPVIVMLIAIIVRIDEFYVVSFYVMPVVALHSLANALSILCVITPYRRAIIDRFKSVFGLNKKTNPQITNISTVIVT